MSTLLLTLDPHGIATLMLNRPTEHNALNGELIAALHDALIELEQDARVRVLVLTGSGKSFCAGGDLAHMQRMGKANESDNFSDAMQLARCLRKLDEFPAPVVARVNGSAFGGGIGLICCCDIAIGVAHAKFSLSEVKLGLAAATISPYLINALGARHTRRWLLNADTLDATQAKHLGLLHDMSDAEHLDQVITQEINLLLQGGPQAQRASKQLLRELTGLTSEQ